MKFSVTVRSLEEQQREEFEVTSNPVWKMAKESKIIRRGYYLCSNCQKPFVDLASKRAHLYHCLGGS